MIKIILLGIELSVLATIVALLYSFIEEGVNKIKKR